MIGVYFSGTGNSKFCVTLFVKEFDPTAKCYSIEDKQAVEEIKKSDSLVFGFPVYYSNLPKIVYDFIVKNQTLFHGKKVFIIATMGLFSGDGVGCLGRLLARFGAQITGGLHLKMPDCIADEKLLKKTAVQNQALLKQAELKIKKSAAGTKNNKAPKEGLGILCRMSGLFGQRLWFYNKTKAYSDRIRIDKEKCIGCGICTRLCPMGNLTVIDKKAAAHDKCTMCYRCISHCPRQAVTLLGKRVYEQYRIEDYL